MGDARSPSPVSFAGDFRVDGRSPEQKAVADGARVIDAEEKSQEVRGRPSDSSDLHRLRVALPGDRAAVRCKQPESNSPSAVQTLHLDGAGDTGDHSVRRPAKVAEVAAAVADDVALARGGGSSPISPIGKRPPRAGQAAPRRTSPGLGGANTPPPVAQGQGQGQEQGEPHNTKSAPPLRPSVPSLEPPAAPPRPDQAPAQRRQPGEIANWQRLAALRWQSGDATTSPEQQRSKEASARFREMKQLAETDWGEVQTALLFGNEWCDLVTETDILDAALDFFDI